MKRGSVNPRTNPTTGEVRYHARLPAAHDRRGVGDFDTEDEAWQHIEDVLEELEPGPGLTLRKWGRVWLKRRENGGQHRSWHDDVNRWAAYVDTWERADVSLRRLTRMDVVRWVKALLRQDATCPAPGGKRRPSGKKLSRSAVSSALNLVRCALQDAADEGRVATNVARDVRVPKVPRQDEPWTWLRAAEIDALLALPLTAAQRAIFTLAIYTGLRAGELWGLRWEDVQGTELRVARSYDGPTKGGIVRRVPLLAPALAALRTWRGIRPGLGAALVFPSSGDRSGRGRGVGCMHGRGYDAGWSKLAEQLGRPEVVFHDLRHTCGSQLIQGTWTPQPLSLEQVQVWLGHQSRTTTERYAHLAPDGIMAIAAEARKQERKG